MPSPDDIMNRCRKLGLDCETFPTDSMSSVLASLVCYPMYMVANVDAWTNDTQFRVPVLDIPGMEAIRESFVLGAQEARFDIERDHRRVLNTLNKQAKPSDLVIYEYALETLRLAIEIVSPDLAEHVCVAIARTIVAVARASGEGLGGSGPKISPQEKYCLEDIEEALALSSSPAAKSVLSEANY